MKDSDWFAGLADGEGCFLILAPRSHGRSKFYVLQFQIGLRADDASVIYDLAREFGGSVNVYQTPSQRARNSRPTAKWTIASRADVQRIIRYFDKHPLHTKKAKDYALWREAAILYYRFVGHGGFGVHTPEWLKEAMEQYRRQLTEARKYEGEWEDVSSTEVISQMTIPIEALEVDE